MTWVRTEDALPLHPKMLRLSDGAYRLWSNGLHFANRAVTDGRIDKGLLVSLNHHGRWTSKQLAGFVLELVPGLWIDHGDHFEIHDYAHHQAEAMKGRVERRRESERDRQRRHRDKSDAARAGVTRDMASDKRCDNSVPSRPVPDQSATHSSSARDPGFGFGPDKPARDLSDPSTKTILDVLGMFYVAIGSDLGLPAQKQYENVRDLLREAVKRNPSDPLNLLRERMGKWAATATIGKLRAPFAAFCSSAWHDVTGDDAPTARPVSPLEAALVAAEARHDKALKGGAPPEVLHRLDREMDAARRALLDSKRKADS